MYKEGYDVGLKATSNRWMTLVIDIVLTLTIFSTIKILLISQAGWMFFIGIYLLTSFFIPMIFFGGKTLGRKVCRIVYMVPEGMDQKTFVKQLWIRETVRVLSIFLTFGAICFVYAVMLLETNKMTLHEKVSGIRVMRKTPDKEMVSHGGFSENFYNEVGNTKKFVAKD